MNKTKLIFIFILLILFITTTEAFQRRQRHQYNQQQQRQQQKPQNQGLDYYKLFGVKKNASEKEIRKAFKKLSIKYHPDKNQENAEEAQSKFAEIANAYEVLMDPEQRKIYDQFGEQGIKEGRGRQQQQNMNHQDMFSQFFRQGGGGGGFNFNMGGGQQQQKQNLFEKSDVFELNMEKIRYFYRRNEVWLIFFYKSTNIHERKTQECIDIIKELATKFYGIFKVAAIDCEEEDALCEEEFQAYHYPIFMAYESNSLQPGHNFNKDVSYKTLAGFAISKMENFVRYLNIDNYNDFITQDPQQEKAIIFTRSKSAPPLIKAFSKELRGKMSFGIVRSEDFELMKKFNFQEKDLPVLLVLTDAQNFQGEKYEGEFDKDRVMTFLRPYAYSSLKKQSQPKEPKLFRLTQKLSKQGGVCGKTDKTYCFLTIYDKNHTQEKEIIDILESLADKYIDEQISFYYIEKNNIEFPNLFEDGDCDDFPSAFIIKGKRNKYRKFRQNSFHISFLETFVDDTLSGGGNYIELYDTIKGNIFDTYEDAKINTDL
ncbi:Thioredoxin-like fold [Pseudocohnilembus persalinus]|uniref:Thioredoxin-like fold n=1 Tax=Pseudocohnilembus persalinus TaxID=266149 RepID=A0A0V0QQD6_PSEPJ|nr:Thioredoxin-like fold [Pseudocohnilembus persalinus]|eukprot:KRX04412.1 Thioredoxin-like fold [Pseudocohnilembus persalinus]